MARGTALVFVAIAAGLLVFLLLAPHPAPGSDGTFSPLPPAVSVPPPVEMPPSKTSSEAASPSIPSPRSEAEREAEVRERDRAPFYNNLLVRFRERLREVHAAPEDGSVLELYAAYDSPEMAQFLVQNGAAPDGQRNGFRRARVYLPNERGSVDRDRLDAEATLDWNGVWRIFKK